MLKSIFSKNKRTLKKLRKHNTANREALHRIARQYNTLGSGDIEQAVKLPTGKDGKKVDLNEWLSVNTIDFFNEMSLMLGSLLADNICTKRTCPQMRAGPKFKYMWADGVKYKTPVVLCATEYIDCLMDWVESQLDDEDIFPVNSDNYPKNFQNVVKTIFRRLFRVYAHLYHHHFEQIEKAAGDIHLNTAFKHFILFSLNFGLIPKDERGPLQDLIKHLLEKNNAKYKSRPESKVEALSTTTTTATK
eukprot:CAMPEP_0184491038 /NCGR_PEP_ID=MMETSP0113_2-20130426/19493_1 /TAXON_ID=91329 /ORGANISM="Norrisiella sphaerica, Strain BC52" /LENGTH=246 /DNA_ID=CAMNT_0026875225 /DNA_START=352 /DNA_END=1092 /DNA_ORIENTATION=-